MKTSRRSFLQVGLALPTVARAALTAPRGDSSFDPRVEVLRANIRHNLSEIRRRAESRPILAVIKNNGYGAGVVNIARILEPEESIGGFAVVKLQEAVTLRDAGIHKPVLLMGPFDEEDLEEIARRGIQPMVYTPLGKSTDRIAARIGKPVSLHVCVDTGIGRVGVSFRKAAPLIRDFAARKSLVIRGTMMTFAEDPEFDKEQLARFQLLCQELERDGVSLGKKHAVSSFGLFQRPEAFLDMVRPGMAIYGIYSEKEFRGAGVLDLRPGLRLKVRVAYVKKLSKGESAGYNRAYVAKDDVWVATLPAGHADGWPREAARGARVRIGGRLYQVIASVSASHTIVEIGTEPRVQIGDEAVLFDDQEGSRPEDVSAACGVSVYDLTMHLNPLLPREIR